MNRTRVVACAVAFCVLAGTGVALSETSAAGLLKEGFDAIADEQPTEARTVFNRLVKLYPHSPEAAEANRELRRLDGEEEGDTASTSDGPEADTAGPESKASVSRSATLAGERARQAFVMDVGDRVFFAQSSDSLGGRARAIIENQARWIGRHPGLIIHVIGHADDGGSAEEGRQLSLRRAEAVRARLIEAGVPEAGVSVQGLGSTMPVATCRTPLCQAQNRRVETHISLSAGWRPPAIASDSPEDVSGEQPVARGAAAVVRPGESLAR